MAADRPVDIPKLAGAYRRLVLWFGAQLAISFGGVLGLGFISSEGAAALAALVWLVLLLATLVMLAIHAYRTATALGSRMPFVWALAMAIPWVALLSLLILSARSTQACRSAGVPVGFLGPRDVAKEQADQAKAFE